MVVDTTQSAAVRAARIIRCQYPDVEIPDVPITEFVLGRASNAATSRRSSTARAAAR